MRGDRAQPRVRSHVRRRGAACQGRHQHQRLPRDGPVPRARSSGMAAIVGALPGRRRGRRASRAAAGQRAARGLTGVLPAGGPRDCVPPVRPPSDVAERHPPAENECVSGGGWREEEFSRRPGAVRLAGGWRHPRYGGPLGGDRRVVRPRRGHTRGHAPRGRRRAIADRRRNHCAAYVGWVGSGQRDLDGRRLLHDGRGRAGGRGTRGRSRSAVQRAARRGRPHAAARRGSGRGRRALRAGIPRGVIRNVLLFQQCELGVARRAHRDPCSRGGVEVKRRSQAPVHSKAGGDVPLGEVLGGKAMRSPACTRISRASTATSGRSTAQPRLM